MACGAFFRPLQFRSILYQLQSWISFLHLSQNSELSICCPFLFCKHIVFLVFASFRTVVFSCRRVGSNNLTEKNPQWRAWSPRDAAVIQNEQYIMIFGAIWSRKFSILINYISYILLDLPDFLNLTALFGLIASSQTFPPQQHWSLILRKCWSWLQLPGVLQGQILIELAFCKRCLLQEIIRVLA